MKMIEFAEGLELPLAFGASPIALLAQRGRGKTRTAKRLAESFLKAGIPPIILDPVGVWWGLRLGRDGKHSGLDIPILGGFHGDKPLLPTAGKVIAEALVETRRPCILDTTGFATQGEQRRFMTDFAETFYRGKMKNPSPCHLFLEEAQEWVPQMPGPDEARMLGAFQRIFGQGRNFGIGATLISLFPQMISKRVLNLAEVLIVLGLRGSHERKAMKLWMEDHEVSNAEREKAFDLMQHLGFNKSTKKDGGSLIWVPDMNVFGVHKIIAPTTFDSSKTPEPGDAPREAAEPKPLDLEDLSRAMAATIEEAKANDPAALKAEIVKLKRELATKPVPVAHAPAKIEIREVPALSAKDRHAIEKTAERFEKAAVDAFAAAAAANAITEDLRKALAPAAVPRPAPIAAAKPAPLIAPKSPTKAPIAAATEGGPAKGVLTLLGALASRHPTALTRKQLATLAGMKASGGAFRTYLSAGRVRGLITRGEPIALTPEGLALAGEVEMPSTHAELMAMWGAKLGNGEKAMLAVLVAEYPAAVDRETLAGRSGFEVSGGAFRTYLSKLRVNGLAVNQGEGIAASPTLFPEAM